MRIVNIHEAKTHFSKLIDGAINGEEVIIAKAGMPVAILKPIPKANIQFGILKGKVKISADFDAPLPDDILDSFEGR